MRTISVYPANWSKRLKRVFATWGTRKSLNRDKIYLNYIIHINQHSHLRWYADFYAIGSFAGNPCFSRIFLRVWHFYSFTKERPISVLKKLHHILNFPPSTCTAFFCPSHLFLNFSRSCRDKHLHQCRYMACNTQKVWISLPLLLIQRSNCSRYSPLFCKNLLLVNCVSMFSINSS